MRILENFLENDILPLEISKNRWCKKIFEKTGVVILDWNFWDFIYCIHRILLNKYLAMQKPNVIYKLDWLTKVMEEELKNLVDKNLEVKMSSSLKRFMQNEQT